ncbi:MAG TPA: thioesterase family protein [Anaerohalosphaeraceae bacterium]|jgi:1,4-dihydroxy-2-naphthoyl-CoA hydrolase|nr:thioesterase family protein [Anaerohalosphaeraceae bacterium]HRT50893.1 thioesterase family protein [Anaerohalosphaeraceae bacterium]HRT86875.1 thioesterase family protein [Anaerohalosphaeraceae bacterium]
MFRYETVVRMRDTDAAGVMFFAGVLVVAHECYEAFLEGRQMSLGAMLADGQYLVPIVHVEADIRKSMRLSERITVAMSLAKAGKSSFELAYQFVNAEGEETAKVKTVHALVDAASRKSVRIPDELMATLKELGTQ